MPHMSTMEKGGALPPFNTWVLPGRAREAGSWQQLKEVHEQLWLPIHGAPATVRGDPAGTWLSEAADQYFAGRGVYLDPIPAEAHYQIGVVERAI